MLNLCNDNNINGSNADIFRPVYRIPPKKKRIGGLEIKGPDH